MVFSGIFLVLCIVNLVIAVPGTVSKITAKMQQSSQTSPAQQVGAGTVEGKEYPNVYYFILDEHIRSDYLYKNTGEDLSEFEQGLKDLGFNISGSSYSLSRETRYSVPNYLSFDNIFHDEIEYPNHKEICENLPLYQVMKDAGYYISATSSASFIVNDKRIDRIILQRELIDEWDISAVALEHAIPVLFTGSAYEQARTRLTEIFTDFEELYLEDNRYTFAFVHLRLPHTPFIFQEDGSAASIQDANNAEDKSVYLGQLRWADTMMIELVTRLITQDPSCIILIQSDHGMRAWAKDEAEAHGIINYFYCQGENIPIEGVSPVNTIRMMLNYIFQSNLEMVEDSIQ